MNHLRALRGWLALLALLAALAPSLALAAQPRAGESVVVAADETVDDDLYLFGGTITVDGAVKGDVVAAGGTITLAGPVDGDVLVAGGTTTIAGPVHGSIRVASGQARLNGAVDKDVMAAGGSVVLNQPARVGRDLYVGGGSTVVNGAVGRNLVASAGTLVLNGTVGGSVSADVGELRLEPGAQVRGDLRYQSPRPAAIAAGASVAGTTAYQPRESGQPELANPAFWIVVGWLRLLVGTFVLGLALVLLFPHFGQRASDTLFAAPGASAGLGCVLLAGVPLLALIVFGVGIVIGGWWLGLLALALYLVALALGYVLFGLAVGRWILGRLQPGGLHLVWPLLLGLVLLTLLTLVPVLGALVSLAAIWLGLGALALALFRSDRLPPTPVPAVAEPPSPALPPSA